MLGNVCSYIKFTTAIIFSMLLRMLLPTCFHIQVVSRSGKANGFSAKTDGIDHLKRKKCIIFHYSCTYSH